MSPEEESVFSLLKKNLCLDDEFLLKNAVRLLEAPRVSTLKVHGCEDHIALEILKQIYYGVGFSFKIIEKGIIGIDSIGPNEIVPNERRVIIDIMCAQSVMRGANVFAPGILGIEDFGGNGDDFDVSIWVDLEGLCLKGLKIPYGGNVKFIGNGKLLMQRNDIFSGVKGIAISSIKMKWTMPSFDDLPKNIFYPQNLPCIIAALSLEVENGERILDMCASPGGKTSCISSFIGEHGKLIAIDRNNNKVNTLRKNLEYLKIENVECYKYDSTKLVDENGSNGLWNTKPPYPEGSFDRILLDPPCSGFGQRPLIIGNKNIFDFENFDSYQKKLFSTAFRLVKNGGRIIYSTCTLHPAENEGVVEYILENFSVKLLDPSQCCRNINLNYEYSCGIPYGNLDDSKLFNLRRFWPSDKMDSIGFFFAIFEKK